MALVFHDFPFSPISVFCIVLRYASIIPAKQGKSKQPGKTPMQLMGPVRRQIVSLTGMIPRHIIDPVFPAGIPPAPGPEDDTAGKNNEK
jgi:hypothetical protein